MEFFALLIKHIRHFFRNNKTFILLLFTINFYFFSNPIKALENHTAAVTVKSCDKMINATHSFILVLNTDDDLLSSISQCAKAAKLKGAAISGLGQLHNPTLAYFTKDAKQTLKTFTGYYELTSINGNVSINDKNYYTHAHVSLADNQFHGITGHIIHATVGLTAEITITPFSQFLYRNVDAKTGFGPITP